MVTITSVINNVYVIKMVTIISVINNVYVIKMVTIISVLNVSVKKNSMLKNGHSIKKKRMSKETKKTG